MEWLGLGAETAGEITKDHFLDSGPWPELSVAVIVL
jgi:hypothetical protein